MVVSERKVPVCENVSVVVVAPFVVVYIIVAAFGHTYNLVGSKIATLQPKAFEHPLYVRFGPTNVGENSELQLVG